MTSEEKEVYEAVIEERHKSPHVKEEASEDDKPKRPMSVYFLWLGESGGAQGGIPWTDHLLIIRRLAVRLKRLVRL